MRYIVVDFEWNQAMSAKSSVFDYLPIHLRGEIIQIGAVKLDENLRPAEEFQTDVRPMYFRKMHHKVKKITGFDVDRLRAGISFPEAMEKFMDFCGPDCVFLTWGYDDFGVMEQNLIIHDMDIDWLGRWVNLQIIYNLQTGGDKNQKSLASAMEHFEIEQTRVAHDALGDAYNTALVCSKLDLESGVAAYDDAARILAERTAKKPRLSNTSGITEQQVGEGALEHRLFGAYDSRVALWADQELINPPCPDCHGELAISRWVNQGGNRYMALGECPEHGNYLIRLHIRETRKGGWIPSRIIYKATEEMAAFYQKKSRQPRHRSGRRR
ncbi:MAG: exonuclease domain-containing protein [Firmicutes bacterium]|nr:exonuclease domain-containing protein [Bacillota bacterium]